MSLYIYGPNIGLPNAMKRLQREWTCALFRWTGKAGRYGCDGSEYRVNIGPSTQHGPAHVDAGDPGLGMQREQPTDFGKPSLHLRLVADAPAWGTGGRYVTLKRN